ncbi:hypothetical protein KIL84_001345, partial [Mauremys mutica]
LSNPRPPPSLLRLSPAPAATCQPAAPSSERGRHRSPVTGGHPALAPGSAGRRWGEEAQPSAPRALLSLCAGLRAAAAERAAMKVAVLDLGTIFARLFKPSAAPAPGPAASCSPVPGAAPGCPAASRALPPSSPLHPLPAPSFPRAPVPYSLPASPRPLPPLAGGSPASAAAALPGRAAPGGGAGVAQPPGGGGSSPRQAAAPADREPSAWAAPGAKPLLFVTLPDIGEEGVAESDPEGGACAPGATDLA